MNVVLRTNTKKKKWPNLDLLWEHVNFNVLISRNNSIEMMWKWRITKKVTRRTATCVTSPLIIQNLDGDWTLSLEELKKQASESDWHRLESQSLHLSAVISKWAYFCLLRIFSSFASSAVWRPSLEVRGQTVARYWTSWMCWPGRYALPLPWL